MSAYFDPNTGRIAAGSLAKSTQINDLIDKVGVGFDKLTTPTQIQTDTSTYGIDTGAVNAYAVALPKTQTTYIDGMQVVFKPVNSNTGASTIDVDGIGPKGIKRPDGTDIIDGDLLNTQVIALRYDGVNFVLASPASSFAAVAADASAAASSAAAALASENAAASSASAAASSAAAALASENAAASSAAAALASENAAASSAAAAATVVQDAKASQAEVNTGTETDKWVSPATLAGNATSNNTADRIVKRDSSGDFAARHITAVKVVSDIAADNGTVILNAGTNGLDAEFTGKVVSGYNGVPSGAIMPFAMSTVPSAWLECDGSVLNAVTNPEYTTLYTAIGNTYGGTDNTDFVIPDLRGQFIRGWDHGAGVDPNAASRTDRGDGTTGDNVGTKQDDKFALHDHPATGALYLYDTPGGTNPVTVAGPVASGSAGGSATVTASEGGDENRPVNTNVMFCIKI
jgi:microcystin-dependent protein